MKAIPLETTLTNDSRVAGNIAATPAQTILTRESAAAVASGVPEGEAEGVARAVLADSQKRAAAVAGYRADIPRDFLPQRELERLAKIGPFAVYKAALRRASDGAQLTRRQNAALSRHGLTLGGTK